MRVGWTFLFVSFSSTVGLKTAATIFVVVSHVLRIVNKALHNAPKCTILKAEVQNFSTAPIPDSTPGGKGATPLHAPSPGGRWTLALDSPSSKNLVLPLDDDDDDDDDLMIIFIHHHMVAEKNNNNNDKKQH